MSLISNAMSIPNNQSNFLEKFTVMVSLLGSFQHTIWHQRMAQECFHILWPCAQSGFVGRVNAFLSRNLYRRILTLNKIIDSVGFRDKLFQSTVSVRVKYTFKVHGISKFFCDGGTNRKQIPPRKPSSILLEELPQG